MIYKDKKPLLYRVVSKYEYDNIRYIATTFYMAVPIPYTGFYYFYQKSLSGSGDCTWTEPSTTKLYTREQIEKQWDHPGFDVERVDRLTALLVYGVIVEE